MPLTFYLPILRVTDRLHTAAVIQIALVIGTLNIQDVWGFGMAQAIRAVERRGFDVMILNKTKISTPAYCQNRLRYETTCSTARPNSAGGAQFGVRLVTR